MNTMHVTPNGVVKKLLALFICALLLVSTTAPASGQVRVSGASSGKSATKSKTPKKSSRKARKDDTKGDEPDIVAERITAPAVSMRTTAEIMDAQASLGVYRSPRELLREAGVKGKKVRPDRTNLPDGPGETFNANRYPLPSKADDAVAAPQVAAQTIGPSFNGVTGPTETGAFPPDTEAEVGPNSIVVHVNGRLRTFSKGTSAVAPAADGVLNVDTDVFFASVITAPGAGEVSFSTDPNVRYDRISNRWFLNIIDVTLNSTTGVTTRVNRVIIAVSDAASNGNITAGTVWTFYQFNGDATLFTDYQSFGVDASAMYIGGNMFTLAGAFNSTKGFVIPKAPALTGSPLTVWAFPGMVATATGAGPFSPRGVDNTDPSNTGPTALGYFIGVDNATFNTLMLRRVTNPGSLGPAPTISANISLATPLTTRFPVKVPHLGNTGGTNGRLDALDDRLFSAMIRNGRLWTAQNIGVNNTGVAGATNNRNAARWYEIQNLSGTPTVVQSGTLFDDNATNDANQRNYWIPTIAVSGQGHAVLGMSIAGTNERINAFVTGRQAGDTLGTMREGPGGVAFPGYTASATAYNPAGDPGGGGGRRWGDYSATTVDPGDDMTMWTFQEYSNGANTYGVRGVRLIAPPPPAALTAVPSSIVSGLTSINVVVTGVPVNGSGFYDPGPNLAAPALPFNHISASISPPLSPEALVVNSVTYNSPTQVTVNLNTTGATPGVKTLVITNPDGQQTSVNINMLVPTPAPADFGGRIVDAAGRGIGNVRVEMVGPHGTQVQTTTAFGYYRFTSVTVGETYIITPTHKRYRFVPASRTYSHNDEFFG
ncbi:MAG TPA: carboxypeptidase-like regulatory domain-containing protein, partial [Pyrinomonadaceae bacterium]|nr:carboxypeptidase-like regulatory domain-containing protein [Pyrinomonadaceae bacterium]